MDLKLIGDLILCAGIVCGGIVMVWAAIQKPGGNDD